MEWRVLDSFLTSLGSPKVPLLRLEHLKFFRAHEQLMQRAQPMFKTY